MKRADLLTKGNETMVAGLLPVNISAGSLLRAAGARSADAPETGTAGITTELPRPEDIPQPAELSMWEQESYQLSASAAGSLGFPLWSGTTDESVRIILFGVSRYADVNTSDHTYRYGVAVRVLVEILDFNATAKLSLPAIAAQVELNDLQASSLLLVSGYVGNISASLPAWQDFDVKSYSEYFAAITGLQKIIFDDPGNMRPVLLGSTLAGSVVNTDPGATRIPGQPESHRDFSFFRPFSRHAIPGVPTPGAPTDSR